MSDQKSVSIQPIRLEKLEESMTVFPIEERIPMDLSDEEVYQQSLQMGMESIVFNSLIPYRNALTTLEKRYIDIMHRFTQCGLDMATEPFIPQYLGFEHKEIEGKGIFYTKGDVTCFPSEDKWFFINTTMDMPVSMTVENMLQGFHIVKGLGANVSIDDYLSE